MQFYKTVKRKRPICTDSGDSPGGLWSSVCDERGSILGHRDGGVGKCARAASHKDTHALTLWLLCYLRMCGRPLSYVVFNKLEYNVVSAHVDDASYNIWVCTYVCLLHLPFCYILLALALISIQSLAV